MSQAGAFIRDLATGQRFNEISDYQGSGCAWDLNTACTVTKVGKVHPYGKYRSLIVAIILCIRTTMITIMIMIKMMTMMVVIISWQNSCDQPVCHSYISDCDQPVGYSYISCHAVHYSSMGGHSCRKLHFVVFFLSSRNHCGQNPPVIWNVNAHRKVGDPWKRLLEIQIIITREGATILLQAHHIHSAALLVYAVFLQQQHEAKSPLCQDASFLDRFGETEKCIMSD